MRESIRRLSAYISTFNPLCVAIALSMLMLAGIIFMHGRVDVNMDTPSYTSAWNDAYMHGEIDEFRTPVYPVIIGVVRMVCGENWLTGVVAVQIALFYICSIYFSRMIMGVISNRRVAVFTVFLYFLFYPILKFLTVIGTEAIAFSLLSAWGYCVWRFIERPKWSYGIYISLLTLAEVMLRPSMLLLPIALFGLFVAGMTLKRYRRQGVLLLLTILPTIAVTSVYVSVIERMTGVRTISIVSIVNKYCMTRQYRDVYPELLADYPEVVKLQRSWLDKDCELDPEYLRQIPFLKGWHKHCRELGEDLPLADVRNIPWFEWEYIKVNNLMTYKELDEYTDAVKRTHPDIWYHNLLLTVKYALTKEGGLKNSANIFIPVIYGLLFVVAWIRYRHFSIVNFFTLMIAGGGVLTIVLYAQNDYGRLFLATSPFLILMIGQLLGCVTRHPLGIRLCRIFPAAETPESTIGKA